MHHNKVNGAQHDFYIGHIHITVYKTVVQVMVQVLLRWTLVDTAAHRSFVILKI